MCILLLVELFHKNNKQNESFITYHTFWITVTYLEKNFLGITLALCQTFISFFFYLYLFFIFTFFILFFIVFQSTKIVTQRHFIIKSLGCKDRKGGLLLLSNLNTWYGIKKNSFTNYALSQKPKNSRCR